MHHFHTKLPYRKPVLRQIAREVQIWTYNCGSNFLGQVAATNMRYFAGSKYSRSLVHKKMFGLMWQVVFNKYFVKRGRITLSSFNELSHKSSATIIFGKFANKPFSNSHWLIVSGNCFSLVEIWHTFTWHILFMNIWCSFD